MHEFEGTYFDGKSARPHRVKIARDEDRIRIQGRDGGPPDICVPVRTCAFSPPLGQTRRAIILPDGARCETKDLKSLRVIETQAGAGRGTRAIDFLESRWKMALACLLGLALLIWGFTAWGIPFLARKASDAVPADLTEKLSRQTLEMLDTQVLGPSELEPGRASELLTLFQQITASKSPPSRFRLEFRKGKRIGPNAFSLPSGLVLMTDELVALADNDRELIAVMVHEIAHAELKHGLRILFQNAGAFILISTLVGDAASISFLAGSLPALLIESGYSRQFEREADHAAGAYLIQKGWGTQPFRNILVGLSQNSPTPPAFAIFSSHPELEARLRYLEDMPSSK